MPAEALAAANLRTASPAERWATFRECAGHERDATAGAVETFMRSDLHDTLRDARELAEELKGRGISIAIGREDPAADYTIVTAAPLWQKGHQALMEQENDNTEAMDEMIGQGRQSGAPLSRGLNRESDLATTMQDTIIRFGGEDREQAI